MSYDMTFIGRFSFADQRAANEAEKAFTEYECLEHTALHPSDLQFSESSLSVDADLSAPATSWEHTLDLLATIARHAAEGHIDATYDGGEGEAFVYRVRILAGGDEVDLDELDASEGDDDDEEEQSAAEIFNDAAMAGDMDAVRRFLDEGRDPAEALSGAIFKADILRLLIERGANPQAQLRWAAQFGFSESVDIILRTGVAPDFRAPDDMSQTTPLMMAAYHGKAKVVARLLDAGADPNAIDWLGQTPLFHAVTNHLNAGRMRTIELLLGAGADPGVEHNGGQTAAQVVSERKYRGHDEVLKLLVRNQ